MKCTNVLEDVTNKIVDVCQDNQLNAIESQICLTTALHSLTQTIYQEAKEQYDSEQRRGTPNRDNLDVV